MPNQPSRVERTGRIVKRLCLVLDCLLPHDFSTATSDFVNLQHYVIKEKKLMEKEAVVIFYDIVRIVDNLHKVGVLFVLFISFCHLHRFIICRLSVRCLLLFYS